MSDNMVFWDDMWNPIDDDKNFDEDHSNDMVLNQVVNELMDEDGEEFLKSIGLTDEQIIQLKNKWNNETK